MSNFARVLKSKSQFGQDLLVLGLLDWKREGYFVEIGATDGINLSNSHLLEQEFKWNGILVEPDKYWHAQLEENRNALIDKRCVWSKTGERIQFFSSDVHELSTIEKFRGSDFHFESRRLGSTYEVQTVTLTDLLDEHNAPRVLDYLSVDTEGSEFEILSSLNFDKYDVRVISVEHNHSPRRALIFNFLTDLGYIRVFDDLSGVDDWYFKEDAIFKRRNN